MTEETRPDEERYFCPVRWFISLRLNTALRSLPTKRVLGAKGHQWIYSGKVEGISLPWTVWLKVLPGRLDGPLIVAIESSYLAGTPPKGGQEENFRFIALQTKRTGQLYGDP